MATSSNRLARAAVNLDRNAPVPPSTPSVPPVEYRSRIEPAEEGGFTALADGIDGAVSQGETVAEALDMLREAVELITERPAIDLNATLGGRHIEGSFNVSTPGITDLEQIAIAGAQTALRNLSTAPIFDAFDNRVTVTLSGSLLVVLREQWTAFNSARTDKVAFSTYLTSRIQQCSHHTDPHGLYLSGNDLTRVQTAAAGDFQSPTELANWIDTTRSLALVTVDGRSCIVPPIEVEVWERLEFRLNEGQTMSELVNEVVMRALNDEAGLS